MKKFWAIVVLLIIGRLYDIITTYLYTPDLAREGNPIVSWFGGGWAILMTIQIILLAAVIWALYSYLFKFSPVRPTDKDLSFTQYISYFYFNDKHSFLKAFYRIPKNKKEFFASLGYVITWTLICTSFIVGTSTLTLLLSDKYREIYRQGVPALLIAMMVVLAFYFYYNFFSIQYNQYKNYET